MKREVKYDVYLDTWLMATIYVIIIYIYIYIHTPVYIIYNIMYLLTVYTYNVIQIPSSKAVVAIVAVTLLQYWRSVAWTQAFKPNRYNSEHPLLCPPSRLDAFLSALISTLT